MPSRTGRRLGPRRRADPAVIAPRAGHATAAARPDAAWSEHGRVAAQAIAASGIPVSLARIAVLLVMRQSASRHTTAEQLCRAMMASPHQCALSTFRTSLYELTEGGLVWRVSVPAGSHALSHYYELADQPAHEHLFCTRCHRLEEVFDAPLMDLQRASLAAQGMRPAPVRGALVGVCRDCLGCIGQG